MLVKHMKLGAQCRILGQKQKLLGVLRAIMLAVGRRRGRGGGIYM